MVNSVQLSSDVYFVCLSHALSTEREEVMGLLLGEIAENRVVHISSAYAMRRSDKRPDRVEISPEQLSAAVTEAERLKTELQRPIQVLGWYHSHPHITVWPSHVDVRTQANYQQLDPNFVGLIFSCFNDSDKKSSLQVICFQSVPGEQGLEHIQLPLSVVPTATTSVSMGTVQSLIRLPSILLEEEDEAYSKTEQDCTDLLAIAHNSGVYTQALSRVMQVVVGPMLHFLQEETSRNRHHSEQLLQEREELRRTLKSLPSSRTDTLGLAMSNTH